MSKTAFAMTLAIGFVAAACAPSSGSRAPAATTPGVNVPPGRIGDYPPPGSDSIMTSGPYAGAPARLVCDKYALETGEFLTCAMTAKIMGPRGVIEVALGKPDTLHATTPDIVAFTTKGQGELVAKSPGWTVMWARVHGAVAYRPINVGGKFGSLHLSPNVRDTTLRVGDTMVVRMLVVDDTGAALPVRRGEAFFSSTLLTAAGKFEQLDSMRMRFVATNPGRAELHATYRNRGVNMSIKVDSAPHRLIAVRHPILTVIAMRGPSSAARVGLLLMPDSALAFTDSIGVARFYGVPSGTHTIIAMCPVSRRLIGREFGRRTIQVESRNDPGTSVTMQPTECIEPSVETIRGTFEGHYSTGLDGDTFQPCRNFPPPNGDAYDPREPVAWVALSDTTARDARLAKLVGRMPADGPTNLYVRWSGTLSGPGSYGVGGRTTYLLHVERILEIRRSAPTDCRR